MNQRLQLDKVAPHWWMTRETTPRASLSHGIFPTCLHFLWLSRPWLPSLGLYPLPPGTLIGWLKKGIFSRKDWLDESGKSPYTKAQTIHRRGHLCSVTTPVALLWLHWGWLGTEAFLACGPGTPLGPFFCLSCLGVHWDISP